MVGCDMQSSRIPWRLVAGWTVVPITPAAKSGTRDYNHILPPVHLLGNIMNRVNTPVLSIATAVQPAATNQSSRASRSAVMVE
jgi:hypothetical protein